MQRARNKDDLLNFLVANYDALLKKILQNSITAGLANGFRFAISKGKF